MSDIADKIVSTSFDNCCILCAIFLLITFLNLVGLYSLPAHNPQMVFGYISLIHLIALPLYYFHFLKKSQAIFLFLNIAWIILMAIAALSFALMKAEKDETIIKWKSDPLSHVLLTVYIACGILLEIFIFIARRNKIHTHSHASSVQTTSTTSASTGSQVVVPVQEVEPVVRTYPKQTYQVVATARSPPPRPPPPSVVTYQRPEQVVTYQQPEQVVLAPAPPKRHHRTKHQHAIVSPVLSTATGNTLVAMPGVQVVSDPSV